MLHGFALALIVLRASPPCQARELVERLRSDEIEQREEAARRLRDLGEGARADLEKASGDPDPEVAGRARHVLRLIEVRGRLTPNLMNAMHCVDERLAAGEGRHWTQAFFEALELEGIQTEDLGGLFPEVVQGLETIDEKYSLLHEVRRRGLVPAARGILWLLEDKDVGTCRQAAHVLLTLGWKEATPEFVALLRSGDYDKRAIPRWGLKGMDLRPVMNDILCLLESEDEEIRSSAVRAVGDLGIRAAEPRLIEILKHDSRDEDLRWAVALALGKLALPDTVRSVIPLLGSAGTNTRWGAVKTLGELGDPGTIPAITALLDDREESVRIAAAEALGKVGNGESARKLLAILRQEDRDEPERLAILKALVELRDMGAASGLESLLRSQSSWVRRDSISSLGRLGATKATGKLAAFLGRKADYDRLDEQLPAILALGRMGAKDTIPLLESLMAASEEGVVLWMAASSLCRMGVRKSAAPLLRAAEDALHGLRSGPIDDEDAEFCPLNPLNALRQPGIWEKLGKSPIPETCRGTIRELLTRVAGRVGLGLEVPESRYWKEDMWMRKSGVIRSRAGEVSVLQALEELLPGEPFSFILEADRIRVLPTRDAIDIWKAWTVGEKLR